MRLGADLRPPARPSLELRVGHLQGQAEVLNGYRVLTAPAHTAAKIAALLDRPDVRVPRRRTGTGAEGPLSATATRDELAGGSSTTPLSGGYFENRAGHLTGAWIWTSRPSVGTARHQGRYLVLRLFARAASLSRATNRRAKGSTPSLSTAAWRARFPSATRSA